MVFGKSVTAFAAFLLLATTFLSPTPISADRADIVAESVVTEDLTIHDLTKNFSVRGPSPDSEAFEKSLSEDARDIRRMIVADDGEIVLEYQRDNVDDDKKYEMWSLTKVFTMLLTGMVVLDDEYDLTLNSTLGEIFANRTDAWSMIDDPFEVEFKKNITVWEMMTFTSGLSTGVRLLDQCDGTEGQLKDRLQRMGPLIDNHEVSNVVGRDLAESLYTPAIRPAEKGNWTYLITNNILSYVVLEATGKNLDELLLEWVFPYIGLGPDDVEWDPNDDGVPCSYSGLRLTARSIAKFAQLLLQWGKSGDTQVIPEEWLAITFSDAVFIKRDPICSLLPKPHFGGMRWELDMDLLAGPRPSVWKAAGFMGQWISIDFNNKRIVIVQRSNTITEGLFKKDTPIQEGDTTKYAVTAHYVSDVTFEIPEGFVPDSASSSVFFLSGAVFGVVASLSMIVFFFY